MRPGAELTVILHQTRSPDNLGAVCRIMANFDFQRLILSEPITRDFTGAERLAVKSDHVLKALTVAPTLAEAVKDCVYVVGSTSRTQVEGRSPLTPEEAARRLAEESKRGRVALLFGGEQRGLSDEDLTHCADVLVIPTSDVQPSMNLAQSASVLLYLCHRQGVEPSGPPAEEPGARLGTLGALSKRMRETMLAADFLNRQAPDHVLHELEQTLMRSRLTQREAELWLNAFKHLGRAVTPGTSRE
ncbi:RNA methyltransferase [Corallococcus praedator]|uniref:RNA methyltransferase n=1 Tax=Corallococcus praedator TaxID=2316724 RepID=A0ABX9QFL5_9BACT|nr:MULTISPECIES: RNA methyltransferase [Corallococcus]RKH07978.1 RNA methyltransferase [Corallococcus sp. CA047B]RKH29892.1 RNA methyltransferase [Corallococcus sp. CA031C]RKI06197.1 RNA methyltransferase [Corallococcus praedator]